MTVGFFGWLVFALVFFGIYSLHQIAFTTGQTRTIHILLAVVFIVLAWIVGRLF